MTHNGAFSTASLGRLSRLDRLGGHKAVHLLAMDHAVTEGWYDGQDNPTIIAREVIAAGANGVVCHRGMLRLLPSEAKRAVFLQLYGSAILGTPKAQILSPQQALSLDCVGVSVELDADGDESKLASAFAVVEESQRLGLLTLLMVGFSGDSSSHIVRALAIATQVGPDFVKIRMVSDKTIWDDDRVRQAVSQSPPLLMAGGKIGEDFETRLNAAKTLGFRGTCIGRSYFWSDQRSEHLRKVITTFA
jgi:2-amino-4,5-dihydroxy-6-oxo-7-(phosphonooxy)heptanoate synthase